MAVVRRVEREEIAGNDAPLIGERAATRAERR